MERRPRVSAITAFLNAENFLEEAIESVLSQTYTDWELLLVDDGSTDGSTRIALRYAERFPEKVRYLEHPRHENQGASASRNLGIRESLGEYLAFLDADDVWLPKKLADQVTILDAEPEAAMVYGASQDWRSWAANNEADQRDTIPSLGITPGTLVNPPTLLVRALDATARTPGPSNLLVRSVHAKRIGGFEEHFRGPYQLFEDQTFLAKLYLTEPVFVAGECWDRYRLHPDSCVSRVKRAGQKYAVGLYYLEWLGGYLTREGITDSAIWNALRKKRWQYGQPKLFRWVERGQHRVRQLMSLSASVARRTLPGRLHRWLQSQ
jgi:glycosyltransferase involved in cell wall biosynthesis